MRPSLSTTTRRSSRSTPKRPSESFQPTGLWLYWSVIGQAAFFPLRKDLQTYLAQEELATVAVDADEGNGELAIKIPEELQKEMFPESNCQRLCADDSDERLIQMSVSEKFTFKLAIEFGLDDPKGGVRFLVGNNPVRPEFKAPLDAENGQEVNGPVESSDQNIYLCSTDHNAHYW